MKINVGKMFSLFPRASTSHKMIYILGAANLPLTSIVLLSYCLQDVIWVKHFVKRLVTQLAEDLENAMID